ncbi:MAG: hypothetical protein ACFFCW_00295 [Candidatus Hodarchaeota archaeon]
MKIKICSKCNLTKPYSDFQLNRSGKDGLQSYCKICRSEYDKKWRQENRASKARSAKKWRNNNKEAIKKYNESRRHLTAEYARKYRNDNLESKRKYHREYQRKRKLEDSMFRLSTNMSHRMCESLRTGAKGNAKWTNLVDFSLDELRNHLEKQFQEGMSWKNYGKWHVDHIIPISAFNYRKPTHIDFKKCWSLSNLRPLWANENYQKNNKLDEHFQPSLLLETIL